MPALYDLAFVGSGVSTAFTLLYLVGLLDGAGPPTRPVRAIVFEASGEFWDGVPYGARSGRGALLISTLREFIPQEREREDFASWLNRHRAEFRSAAGTPDASISSRWMHDHAAAIDAGEWDDLYVPRHLFGTYLRERLTGALDDARARGVLECDMARSVVVDIQRHGTFHRIRTGSGASIHARRVVLAVGSPPYGGINVPADSTDDVCIINRPYEPSLPANLEKIGERLAVHPGDILIVGSNASALEIIYNLAGCPRTVDLMRQVIVLAPDGTLPHRINARGSTASTDLTHLDALATKTTLTSADILHAVRQDVSQAAANGVDVGGLYHDISERIIAAQSRLSQQEREQFVAVDGVEIGRLQRRAGPEYLDSVEYLMARGQLVIQEGRFMRYLSTREGGPGCEYRVGADAVGALRAPVSIVVNCTGFQDVARSTSPLLQNLISNGLCTTNPSRRGFALNADFEASPRLHVMGPLVAGNILGTLGVWHAESCTRIITLSKRLADVLATDVVSPSPVHPPDRSVLASARLADVVTTSGGGRP